MSDEDSGPRGGDTISRNVTFAFAAQMSTTVFTMVLTLYLARALGPSGYGTFALALSVTGLLLKPSDVGTTQAMGRYVAEHHGHHAKVAGVLGMALPMRLTSASVIGLAVFLLADPISSLYNAPELVWPLRGAAIAFFGQSIMLFIRAAFNALRQASSALTLVFSESAMEFGATMALVLLGGGVTGAAFGRAVGYVFGAVLGFVLLRRLLGGGSVLRAGPSPVARREFLGYAGAMLIVTGAGAVFSQIDVLLVGVFLSTSAVGVFSAPLRLVNLTSYPALALAQGVGPRMASHRDDAPRVEALVLSLRYMLIFQTALVTVIAVMAKPIVDIALGSDFSESVGVLRALTPYIFLSGINPMLVSSLTFAGAGRRRIPITLAALALNAVIDVILIPEIGVIGAAIGTGTAYALYAGSHLYLSHHLLGVPLKPLLGTTARAGVAGLLLAALLLFFGTTIVSPLGWALGLTLGCAAFVAALIASGETTVSELRSIVVRPIAAVSRRS